MTITDIWVDSPASMAGGRALWAIPKDLCDFELESTFKGPLTSTHWSASVDRRVVAEAAFTDVSRAAPRAPFKGLVDQPPLAEHDGRGRAVMSGTAKALPCRARWSFAADGPLAFLRPARRLGSFRMADFRLRFE
ncbi:acetoacetate decarboxylase family protein [Nocardioides sp. TF02-7]|nr:acetoacetate decarboxylase family protein [Nocardioides sp. TF02-7]UMG91960.1 acetoacetate decarboxylase family protein [Nocardioides sp. TF02-7]